MPTLLPSGITAPPVDFWAACWILLCTCGLCQAPYPASPVQLVLLTPPKTSNHSCSVFPLLLPPLSVLRSWKGSRVLGRHWAPPARWHGGMGGLAVHRWRGKVGRGFFKMRNVLKAKGTVSSCPMPSSVHTFGKFYVGLKLSLALSVVSSGTGVCRVVSG